MKDHRFFFLWNRRAYLSWPLLLIWLFLILLGALPPSSQGETDFILALHRGPAQRTLEIKDGLLVKSVLGNARSEEQQEVLGEEFVVGLKDRELTPKDCKVLSLREESTGHYVLELKPSSPNMTILLHYQEAEGQHFQRKWLELRPAAGTKIFVDRILLERFQPWTPPESFAGAGQPVYVGDMFFSVAYPSSENVGTAELVSCGYLVGLTVDEKGYVSRQAVFGVAEKGRVREAFLACVDQMRARKVAPFLLWNTWYHLFNYTDQEVIAGIQGLRRGLVEPYGVKLDSVVLDDGWDDWRELWRPHHERFPRGFKPLQEAAEEIGARLGLWMSPLGGYAVNQQKRLLGTMGQGYEKSPRGFCIAGHNYQAAFAERMVSYIRENRVNYFKLDNLTTSCPTSRHGHRVGRYGQVGLTDAFWEVMEKARVADPQVMINITVGSWLSPWWLLACDVVWRGEMDFGFAGEGSLRQKNITYVDQVLYRRLRVERAQFPLSSIMTHGVIKGRRQSFGEKGENLRDFSDDAWMYFTRGVMMQELYLSPELLSPAEWKVLAQAIQFSREHAALIFSSEMVLGDPRRLEVYGFYHERGSERLLVLRNPSQAEQGLPAEVFARYLLTGGSGSEAREAKPCRIIYSSREREITDPLEGMETRVILCEGT